jgi:hypothetical protein
MDHANSNFFNPTHQDPFGAVGQIKQSRQESGTIAEKVRKALETLVTVDYKQKTIHDILEDLKKKVPGLSIHDLSGISQNVIDLQIEGQVPLRTALELVEDTGSVLIQGRGGRLYFVLRDYGLLLAPVASLPPDAVHMKNLGRGVQFTQPDKSQPDKGNAPAKDEKNQSTGEKRH